MEKKCPLKNLTDIIHNLYNIQIISFKYIFFSVPFFLCLNEKDRKHTGLFYFKGDLRNLFIIGIKNLNSPVTSPLRNNPF